MYAPIVEISGIEERKVVTCAERKVMGINLGNFKVLKQHNTDVDDIIGT